MAPSPSEQPASWCQHERPGLENEASKFLELSWEHPITNYSTLLVCFKLIATIDSRDTEVQRLLEGLSSVPRTKTGWGEALIWWHLPVIPAPGRWRQVEPQSSLANKPHLFGEFQASKELYLNIFILYNYWYILLIIYHILYLCIRSSILTHMSTPTNVHAPICTHILNNNNDQL